MAKFKFDLNQEVKITCSGEGGTIIGRAEYIEYKNKYWVRYQNSNGVAVERWWDQSALAAVKVKRKKSTPK